MIIVFIHLFCNANNEEVRGWKTSSKITKRLETTLTIRVVVILALLCVIDNWGSVSLYVPLFLFLSPSLSLYLSISHHSFSLCCSLVSFCKCHLWLHLWQVKQDRNIRSNYLFNSKYFVRYCNVEFFPIIIITR